MRNLDDLYEGREVLTENILGDIINFFRSNKSEIEGKYQEMSQKDEAYMKWMEKEIRQRLKQYGEDVPTEEKVRKVGWYGRFRAAVLKPLSDKLVSAIRTIFSLNDPKDPSTTAFDIFLIAAAAVGVAIGSWKIALLFVVLKTYSNMASKMGGDSKFESRDRAIARVLNENTLE